MKVGYFHDLKNDIQYMEIDPLVDIKYITRDILYMFSYTLEDSIRGPSSGNNCFLEKNVDAIQLA